MNFYSDIKAEIIENDNDRFSLSLAKPEGRLKYSQLISNELKPEETFIEEKTSGIKTPIVTKKVSKSKYQEKIKTNATFGELMNMTINKKQ